jgi:hypothetical protein
LLEAPYAVPKSIFPARSCVDASTHGVRSFCYI